MTPCYKWRNWFNLTFKGLVNSLLCSFNTWSCSWFWMRCRARKETFLWLNSWLILRRIYRFSQKVFINISPIEIFLNFVEAFSSFWKSRPDSNFLLSIFRHKRLLSRGRISESLRLSIFLRNILWNIHRLLSIGCSHLEWGLSWLERSVVHLLDSSSWNLHNACLGSLNTGVVNLNKGWIL